MMWDNNNIFFKFQTDRAQFDYKYSMNR